MLYPCIGRICICHQVIYCSDLFQQIAVLLAKRQSTARRDHAMCLLPKFPDDIRLQSAEICLSLLLEDVRNRHFLLCLYIKVGINKLISKLLGKCLSNRCLTGTHITDQDNIISTLLPIDCILQCQIHFIGQCLRHRQIIPQFICKNALIEQHLQAIYRWHAKLLHLL